MKLKQTSHILLQPVSKEYLIFGPATKVGIFRVAKSIRTFRGPGLGLSFCGIHSLTRKGIVGMLSRNLREGHMLIIRVSP